LHAFWRFGLDDLSFSFKAQKTGHTDFFCPFLLSSSLNTHHTTSTKSSTNQSRVLLNSYWD
jgi:hypothetical protein